MNIKQKSSRNPEERLIELLKSIAQLHMSNFPLDKLDLSFSQMTLMRWVANSPGCHGQAIADGLGLTAPTVSAGIHRLVDAGFLDRRPDPNDKRASRIFLSAKGEKIKQQFMVRRQAAVQRLLSGLTSEEQNQLLYLLEKAFISISTE